MKTSTARKVFVGLSGGVDSSVSAALLQKAGYDVTGVFMKVWSPDWLPCTWKEERRDAMRVAAHLNISFLTFDFEQEYKKAVVDYLIAEYRQGRTPNPDVLCNREIKFGAFLNKAVEAGADFIATGHYARNIQNHLYEGVDKAKDQSYFLWTLGKKELAKTLFPVGEFQKSKVRALATKFGLPTAVKRDSQGICFLGPIDMKEFLAHYITTEPGDVLDETGTKVGRHDGALLYTIGERHGFTTASNKPYYVIAKNIEANTITVSHTYSEQSLATVSGVKLVSVTWTNHPPEAGKYLARFRYHQTPVPCSIESVKESDEKITVTFLALQAGVAIGQSLVLYNGEECVGGGIIDETV
jgi:tRNA-specific 2-thiouridylase